MAAKKKAPKEDRVAELEKEVAFLKDLIQQFGHYLIECEDDVWICGCCGKREPLSVPVADFKHESFCPLLKES
jgi:hypothetical protein